MSGSVLVIVAVLAMFVAITLLGRFVGTVRSGTRMRCPLDGGEHNVDFLRGLTTTWSPGKRRDVLACSAFADPERVTCGKECLHGRPATESS
jgi:hypothetical protein